MLIKINKSVILIVSLISFVAQAEPLSRTWKDERCVAYEAKVAREERIETQTKNLQIEDRIIQLCSRKVLDYTSAEDQFGLAVDHFSQATWGALKFFTNSDVGSVAQRFAHVGLTEDAYNVLNYPKLDQVLDQCFKNSSENSREIMKNYFKYAVIVDDTAYAALGAGAGLYLGFFTIRVIGSGASLAMNSITWKPVVSAIQAGKNLNPSTVKALKWTLFSGLTAAAIFTGWSVHKSDLEHQEVAQVAENRTVESIDSPEKIVEEKYQKCLSRQKDAAESTDTRLKSTYMNLASNSCRLYIMEATRALLSLQNDNIRCLPQNKGAAERIEERLNEFVGMNPEFQQFTVNP